VPWGVVLLGIVLLEPVVVELLVEFCCVPVVEFCIPGEVVEDPVVPVCAKLGPATYTINAMTQASTKPIRLKLLLAMFPPPFMAMSSM
jgi:hypothetical protein